jgi:hypothetical protein
MVKVTKKINTSSFYLGGYDAKSCPELVRKNADDSFTDEDKDAFPPGDVARMEAGIIFESKLALLWEAELGDQFFAVPQCTRTEKSKKLREKITTEKMLDPGTVRVIWNARLPKIKKSHQTGEPDALLHGGTDAAGTHLWIPVDVKSHGSLEGQRTTLGTLVSTLKDPLYTSATLVDLGKGIGKKSDAMQLAHYYRMLEHLGHATPEMIGGIIGTELKIIWHKLNEPLYKHSALAATISALDYYDHEFAYRVEIVKAAKKGEAIVGPEWKPECASCIWRTICHDQLKIDMDHITLLAGITPLRAAAHYSVGITRISDVTRLDWKTAKLVDVGIDVPAFIKWANTVLPETLVVSWEGADLALRAGTFPALGIVTAKDACKLDPVTARYAGTKVWNLTDTIDIARATKVAKVFLARNVQSVTLNRSVYEQDIDIEDSNGYVYMIGVRTSGYKNINREDRETRTEYVAFVNWDSSPEGEAKVFADFWRHIQFSRFYAKQRKYAYRMYYYTKHEPSSFKSLATRHSTQPNVPTVEDVEKLFGSTLPAPVFLDDAFTLEQDGTPFGEVLDLFPIITTQLVWPTEALTLKDTAKWVRFSWRDSDPGGANSMAWYAEAVNNPDEEIREKNRKRIIDYNADDVHAQVAIRDWLTHLGAARQPGKKLPNVASLDRRFKHRIPNTVRRHPSLGNV